MSNKLAGFTPRKFPVAKDTTSTSTHWFNVAGAGLGMYYSKQYIEQDIPTDLDKVLLAVELLPEDKRALGFLKYLTLAVETSNLKVSFNIISETKIIESTLDFSKIKI
jgi:bacteriorhodopsin